MEERKSQYIEEVTKQVHSAEAKKQIEDELDFHLKETQKAFKAKGFNEAQAEEKAIEQMGSPSQLGIQLNELYRPKVDWLMLLLFFFIVGFSFLPIVAMNFSDLGSYTGKKIIMSIAGIAAAIGLMFFDYRKLKNFHLLFFGLGMGLLLILNYVSTGMINGYPEFQIGPVSFNIFHTLPIFFLFWASYLVREQLKFWKAISLYILSAFFILNAGEISAILIYSLMVFFMFLASRLSNKKVLGFAGAILISLTAIIAASFASLKDYQLERLYAFMNPEKYSESSGQIYIQIREFLGSAGLFGNAGAMEFIPISHTDLVMVNIIYHFGWLPAFLLFIALCVIAVRMISTTNRIKDSYGKMVIIGGISLFSVQALYNIGMILGAFPLISMSLPLISYGFWPTLLGSIVVGLFLSVYRRKDFIIKTD